ncbi:prenyltransferase/squalene oxidase repeat-containing protein [Bacillus sp. EB600]|uniref:prenyltransferase/squalene oxidase repeat-containing protein n=1 Tax=Bacillus sp. EB600 TaxID=2806345 RepID=UPI0028117DBA|nr:prenyltransferase/squalene oxidase repeat-containing protein [Bacillus sp. EB600]
MPIEDKAVVSAAEYLLSKQQPKGGWGFSETNTTNPDVDDTQAALRAITRFSVMDDKYRKAWNSGLKWLFSMQHDNGGWSAFENNQSKSILTLLPIQNISDSFIDSIASDLTGRTLEFLGKNVGMTFHHPKIGDAVNWLFDNQEENGSWYGRWGISYIYGTWAAVTGLRAVGISGDHPSIQKAVKWLISIQNPDGGWGESCHSDRFKTYYPLAYSTLVQTAWAVDSLVSVYDQPVAEIEKGIEYLLIEIPYQIKVFLILPVRGCQATFIFIITVTFIFGHCCH